MKIIDTLKYNKYRSNYIDIYYKEFGTCPSKIVKYIKKLTGCRLLCDSSSDCVVICIIGQGYSVSDVDEFIKRAVKDKIHVVPIYTGSHGKEVDFHIKQFKEIDDTGSKVIIGNLSKYKKPLRKGLSRYCKYSKRYLNRIVMCVLCIAVGASYVYVDKGMKNSQEIVKEKMVASSPKYMDQQGAVICGGFVDREKNVVPRDVNAICVDESFQYFIVPSLIREENDMNKEIALFIPHTKKAEIATVINDKKNSIWVLKIDKPLEDLHDYIDFDLDGASFDVGEDVYAVGYNLNDANLNVEDGTVGKLRYITEKLDGSITTFAKDQSMNGRPVYNRKGEVLGVITGDVNDLGDGMMMADCMQIKKRAIRFVEIDKGKE